MNQFVELVLRMRKSQKGFFRSDRGTEERQQFLLTSRRLEKEVDKYIKDYIDGQLKLFDNESND